MVGCFLGHVENKGFQILCIMLRNFATKIVNNARGALGATHIFMTGD